MLSICVKLNIIKDICSHDNYQRGNKKGIWELCGDKAHIEALSQLHTF